MIDTLLTIAHAGSEAIELHRSIFPMMDLVQEAVGVVGVLAEDKKQTISIFAGNGIMVFADHSFLHMAVINLLDNPQSHFMLATVLICVDLVSKYQGPVINSMAVNPMES